MTFDFINVIGSIDPYFLIRCLYGTVQYLFTLLQPMPMCSLMYQKNKVSEILGVGFIFGHLELRVK